MQSAASQGSDTQEAIFRKVFFVPDEQTWADLQSRSSKVSSRAFQAVCFDGTLAVRRGSVEFRSKRLDVSISDIREISHVTSDSFYPAISDAVKVLHGPNPSVVLFAPKRPMFEASSGDRVAAILTALKETQPHAALKETVDERRAYLVLLWDTQEWSDAEKQEIAAGKRGELGLPTELLRTVHVDGAMPTEPDTYVVTTALLACKEAGIEFDSKRDEISFKGGEYRPGVGLGLITIIVNAG